MTENYNLIKQAQNFLKSGTDVKNAIVSIFDSTGIAGFQFNIIRSESVKMSNDITDYYSDNNTVFNDHVAHKPIMVTVSGMQGEYFYSVNKIKDMISAVGTTMKLVTGYIPKLGPAQNQLRTAWNNYQSQLQMGAGIANYAKVNPAKTLAQNTSLKDKAKLLFNQFDSYDGVDLFKLFQDLYKFKSAQTRAFLFFEIMRMADKPFTVETRWKRFENMYIQDCTILGEDNADISEFQVVFKQMNFTSSQVLNINAAGRTQQQYWEETNKGLNKGTKVETIKGSK